MRLVWMAAITCAGAICASAAVAAPEAAAPATQPQVMPATSIPKRLLGIWKVYAVAGSSPMFLQADNSRDMIGREIRIKSDEVSIWGAISGTPVDIAETTETLASVIAEPESMKQGHDFPDSGRSLNYVAIGLAHCASDGKPAPQGCPYLYFALNPETGTVSFVPFAWGMAYMKRVGH